MPSRTYQFTSSKGVVSAMTRFTTNSFVVNLPGPEDAEDAQVSIQMTVMFRNGVCSTSTLANFIGEKYSG